MAWLHFVNECSQKFKSKSKLQYKVQKQQQMLALQFSIFILICCFLSNLVHASLRTQQILSQQIVIDYGVGSKLSNIVNPDQRQFYVDIGAYDPIQFSKTVELDMMGWQGINVEPNPARFLRFLKFRPDQMNLNFAIGQSSKYVTLNNFKNSPLSTISENSPLSLQLSNKIQVPSMSMKQLCQIYYHKRPRLINIGTYDYVDKILQSNDWSNSKCVPDMFIIATDPNAKHSQIGKLIQYQVLLTQKQFTRFSVQLENTEIYIRDQLTKSYRDTYLQINEILKPKTVITLSDALSQISQIIKRPVALSSNQNSTQIYIAKFNEPILMSQLFNRVNTKTQQSSFIILLNYNPQSNPIILQSCEFSVNRLSTDFIQIINLTIGSQTLKQRLEVYIFDHNPSQNAIPKIVVTGNICQQAALGGRFIPASSNVQQSVSSKSETKVESIGDFIIQIVFVVIFLVFFSTMNTIIIYYLCKSFKNHIKAQKQKLQNANMANSDMVSSVVNQ